MTTGNPLPYLIARFHVTEVLVYSWVLSATQIDSVESYLSNKYAISRVTLSVSDNRPGVAPMHYSLEQNYPNPFNPSTKIGFRITDMGFVSLKIYDVLGREVTTLVNEVKQPGSYEATFDARGLASGVYLYRLKAGSFTETKRLLLLR